MRVNVTHKANATGRSFEVALSARDTREVGDHTTNDYQYAHCYLYFPIFCGYSPIHLPTMKMAVMITRRTTLSEPQAADMTSYPRGHFRWVGEAPRGSSACSYDSRQLTCHERRRRCSQYWDSRVEMKRPEVIASIYRRGRGGVLPYIERADVYRSKRILHFQSEMVSRLYTIGTQVICLDWDERAILPV